MIKWFALIWKLGRSLAMAALGSLSGQMRRSGEMRARLCCRERDGALRVRLFCGLVEELVREWSRRAVLSGGDRTEEVRCVQCIKEEECARACVVRGRQRSCLRMCSA